jgi:tungstate transport system substrate-binding protein
MFLLVRASPGRAEAPFVTLASTTSTENSGLLADLLPRFRKASGIEVRVVAVGTGQALRLGRAGDADLLLVHDRASEEAFVAAGHGIERVLVMANDFVVVGPVADVAGVRGISDVAVALGRIARGKAPFLSRGDDSGTHKAELRLWQAVGIDPRPASGTWYRETGRGMGGTLNTAAAMGGYTLSDRGTWLSFHNRAELDLLVEGDPRLENPYAAIVVDAERHPHVKAEQAQRLVDWLVSEAGQAAIGGYRVRGERLFYPRAVENER